MACPRLWREVQPLLYSRVVGFLARASQALLMALEARHSAARCHMQVYVDDPAITMAGTVRQRLESVNCLLLFWLCLGVPLAWRKGMLTPGTGHQWIGVRYQVLAPGQVELTLPAPFLEGLVKLLDMVMRKGHIPESKAKQLMGKAARVSHIAPESRPWVGALFAAVSGAQAAARAGRREAPPGQLACSRMRPAVRWLLALVRGGDSDVIVPLRRLVFSSLPTPDPQARRIEFDASPWGGGGVLYVDNVAKEWFALQWEASDASHLKAVPGDCSWQSFYEMCTLVIALTLWANSTDNTATLGDSMVALQNAMKLKGSTALMAVARELAWRKAKHGWLFTAGHLPAEANVVADALSRLSGPDPQAVPRVLGKARYRQVPPLRALWQVPKDPRSS